MYFLWHLENIYSCIFNHIWPFWTIFGTLKNLDFSRALNPWKTISDDSILIAQRSSFNSEKKSKSSIFSILTWSDVYGLYMYALETCVRSWDMVCAVWTQEMSSCGRRICPVGGEEHMSSCSVSYTHLTLPTIYSV